MREQEKVHAPRGWAGGTAWQGAGASLLLHLVVGAAVILTLSGPPKGPPQVIDLTLLPPAGIDRAPVPSAFHAAVKPPPVPKANLLRELAPLTAPPPVANPSDSIPSDAAAAVSSTATPSPTAAAGETGIPATGSPHADLPAPAGPGPVAAVAGIPRGAPGAASGPPTADFAWIRDAIQRAIAYPATARRMGWEGKVVVAFQLLSDGSVRDVRVVQGSGHAALDRGAIDAVRNASPFPRAPLAAEVITPVVYRLTTR
jgi:protein TonB